MGRCIAEQAAKCKTTRCCEHRTLAEKRTVRPHGGGKGGGACRVSALGQRMQSKYLAWLLHVHGTAPLGASLGAMDRAVPPV